MESYGRLLLRGLIDREYQMPDPHLSDIYVSLAAQPQERPYPARGEEKEERPQPVDMANLLSQGDRLVITGGPGSGKTTFLRHIAYLLAYAIYSGDDGPVRQRLHLTGTIPLPVYLSLADYHRYKQEKRDGDLIQFISYALKRQHSVYDLPDNFFAQMLAARHSVCLLLDSLDEIADEDDRFDVTRDVIDLSAHASIRQVLVASRDHAYVGQVVFPLRSRFTRFIVQPMTPEQVDRLAQLWCEAVYPAAKAAAESGKLQEEIWGLEAIRQAQGEEPLVNTPLMVTIVAIVHYNNRELPRQRAALYERCVNALLVEGHKKEEGLGESQKALKGYGGSDDTRRGHLALLAFEMMRDGAGQEVGDDPRRQRETTAGRSATLAQLRVWLLPAFERQEGQEAAAAQLEAFRQAMCDRASLLHERGGRHEFTHLTFQEFFCAYHLAVNRQPGEIAAFFHEEERLLHSWWRETILLTIGYLGRTAMSKSLDLVQALLETGAGEAASLAAAELSAVGLLELEAKAPDLRQGIYERLVGLLTDTAVSAPPSLRALAGAALGRLGDRRKGVCELTPEWVLVAGGEFPMGQGRHPVSVESFAIARYPVTNAQFQSFMEAGGYAQERYWTAEGWAYRRRNDRSEPWLWDDARYNQPNQPVVGVSWYEAVAYANWLTEALRQQGELDEKGIVRLPTEAEWELAGAGLAGRPTPWAGQWQRERANTKEAGVGRPTAVGSFPAGATSEGVHDLLGNVWEWCNTRWRDEQEKEYLLPYQSDDGRERMDGGDEVSRVLKGGAYYDEGKGLRLAARYGFDPVFRYDYIGFRVVASPSTSGL